MRGDRKTIWSRRPEARAADPEPTAGGTDYARKIDPGLPETVAKTIAGLSGVVWNWSEIEDFTVSTVQEVLAARGTPGSEIAPPSLDVAVPAIEAMRYSPLRRQIAQLIASSMDRRTAHQVHPSFVEMLKQLTIDEVRMLRAMPAHGLVLPLLHLNFVVARNRIMTGHRNIVPKGLAGVCEKRRSLPHYVDNLIRMNAIDTPHNLCIEDERRYQELLDQRFVRDLVSGAGAGRKIEIEKSLIGLTYFGETFRRVCLSD